MTRHLEESEKAMQDRVQRLEAVRLSLEEVSWAPGPALPLSGWVWPAGVSGQGQDRPRWLVCGAGAEPGEGGGTERAWPS